MRNKMGDLIHPPRDKGRLEGKVEEIRKSSSHISLVFVMLIWLYIGGIMLGLLIAKWHYDSKYVKLRSEIRSATDVDISYPYGYDDGRLNESWFGKK
jgi:hypothetical protein